MSEQEDLSAVGVIQAFDDYDEESGTFLLAVRVSEDNLKDWMKDGVEITLAKSNQGE